MSEATSSPIIVQRKVKAAASGNQIIRSLGWKFGELKGKWKQVRRGSSQDKDACVIRLTSNSFLCSTCGLNIGNYRTNKCPNNLRFDVKAN